MPRFALLFATLLTLATPGARADVWPYGEAECNQLWFMRNLIMDRAGYCFGTPLGQALYDNGDCLGKQVSLTPAQSRKVADIQALERQIGCRVNTAARHLDLPLMDDYRRLSDMPLPDNGASACLRWIGPTAPLLSGYSAGAVRLATIEPDDSLTFGYIPDGRWMAVILGKGGMEGWPILGWIDTVGVDIEGACAAWAG